MYVSVHDTRVCPIFNQRFAMKKWRCLVCDFVYDEAQGLPEEGIAPGTRWDDIPDSWSCPDCGAAKEDFVMEEID